MIEKLFRLADYGKGMFAGLLGVALNFSIQLMLTRHLGIVAFGTFALWRNNVQLSYGLGTFSLNMLALKEVSQRSSTEQSKLVWPFLVSGSKFVALMSLAGATLIAIPLAQETSPPVAALVAVPCLGLVAFWAAANRAYNRDFTSLLLERAGQPFLFAGVIFAALLGFLKLSSESILFWFSGTCLLTLAFILLIARPLFDLRKQSTIETLGFEKGEFSLLSIAQRSLPFFLISVASFFSARSPLLVSGFFLSAKELGQAAFMLSLAGLISVLLFSVNLIAGPQIAAAYARSDYTAAHHEVNHVRRIMIGVGSLTAAVLYFSAPFMENMAGVKDIIHGPAFVILLTANLVNLLLAVPALFLQMTDAQKALAIVMNVGVALKILLLVPLVSMAGTIGIAVAELAQAVLVGTGVSILYRNKRMKQ